jgi:hypothetical protein
MPNARIHLLTITPLGILIVFCDNLWQFRILSNGSIYGEAKHYYTADAAVRAGREWVGVWE